MNKAYKYKKYSGPPLERKDSGKTGFVFPLMLIVLLVVVIVFTMRMKIVNSAKIQVDDALADATLASALVESYEFGKTSSVENYEYAEMYEKFLETLKISLDLDEDLAPTHSTYLASPVKVEEYWIYNVVKDATGNITSVRLCKWYTQGSLKQQESEFIENLDQIRTPNDKLVESLTIYSKISFDVKSMLGRKVHVGKEQTVDVVLNGLPSEDSFGPTLNVTNPKGYTFDNPQYVTTTTVLVNGSAYDPTGVKSIKVNGEDASLVAGQWQKEITVSPNTVTAITVVATDLLGNTTTEIRYVCLDTTNPALTVTSPAVATETNPVYILTQVLSVTGKITDNIGVKSITGNHYEGTISADGSYTISVPLPADVVSKVEIIGTDKAGWNDSETRYVFYDSKAPDVTITSNVGDSSSSPYYVTASSYTLRGVVSDASGIVSFTINGTNIDIGADNSFSKTYILSTDVTSKFEIIATDKAGRTTKITKYVRYDGSNPDLTVTAPAGTTSPAPTYTTLSNYVVKGTASDASGLKSVTVNGATATIDATGQWNKTITLSADTTTKVTVVATDVNDRTTTVTRYVRYDSAAPSVNVTAPASGTSSAPTYTDTATYTITGTASDAAGLTSVTVNGASVTVDSNGKWSKTISLTVDTTTTVKVVAKDGSGRTTTVTKYVRYDNTNPTLTVIEPTSSSESEPTYVTTYREIQTRAWSLEIEPTAYTVMGTVSDPSGIKSVTVNGTPAAIDGNGNWSLDIKLQPDETQKITVVGTDNAGKTTTLTKYARYDSAEPTLNVTAPIATSSSSPIYTTASSYVVQGTTNDSSGIKSVTVNGKAATLNNDGSWNCTLGLTGNTTTTVTIVSTDKAGRTMTATRYVRYDSSNPTLTITAPTGTSSSAPTETSASTYTVKGTATDASGITSVTVNGNKVTVASDGSWSYSMTLTANTVTTVKVIATDQSGRTTTVTRYVRYDNANPNLTVSAPTATSSSSPNFVSSASYTVKGTASDGSGLKSVTVNNTAVSVGTNGAWSHSLTLTANTTTTVTVVATDMAGKTTTITRYVHYDNKSPNLSVSAPTGITSGKPTYVTDSASYTVCGTVSDASGIASVTVNDKVATLSGNNWSYGITLTANETTKILVTATDGVGNSMTTTVYVRYDTDMPILTVDTPASDESSTPTYSSSETYYVRGSVSDASGIKSVTVNGEYIQVSNGSFSYKLTLSADTTSTVTIVATDNAGRTVTTTRYVRYDNVNPTLKVSTPSAGSTINPTYTTSSSYTVSGTTSDASGIKSLTVNGVAVTVASDGSWSRTLTLDADTTTTVKIIATDNADRTTTVTRYLRYDSANPNLTVTAPTGTVSVPTYTSSSTYTVKGTVSDLSGIKSVTVNGKLATISSEDYSCDLSLTADTKTTVTIVATDNAGKTTTLTQYVQYDSANPTLTVTAPAGTSNSDPTYVLSRYYTVTATASDGSGIKSLTVNGTTITPSQGSYSHELTLTENSTLTVTIVATDRAGKTTTVTRYVRYDSTNPSVSVTAPTGASSSSPTYTTSSSYTVKGTASDASGLSSLTVNDASVTVGSDGSWSKALTLSADTTTTVTVVGKDKAGRSTTVTRYVRYDSAAPTLTVSAPTGTSSSSPTSVTSSAYTVKGTVSDTSGIKSLTVHGNVVSVGSDGSWSYALTLSADTVTTVTVKATDNAGRTKTVTRYVQYNSDTTPPTVSVSAPTGTSSSNPTYVQSDSTYTYTVSGTVSDTSGISSVTVNGNAATVSSGSFSYSLSLATNTTHTITIVATDALGNKTTVTRYVRIEGYYQYAARLAGATVQSSLVNTLTNSTVCSAIAGNSTAVSTMKSKYSSTMTSYIDSNFNDGLNLLNYKCALKCYLYKAGNQCSNITGGWSVAWETGVAGAVEGASVNNNNAMYGYFQRDNDAMDFPWAYASLLTIKTKSSVTTTGYKTVGWNYNQSGTNAVGYRYIYSGSTEIDVKTLTGTRTSTINAATGVQKYTWQQFHNKGTESSIYVYNVYMTP